MKQKSASSPKSRRRLSAEQAAARAARAEKVQRLQVRLGYAIVGASVLLGFLMSLWPRLFGLQQFKPAISVGLTVLALLRLYVLQKEVRKEAQADSAAPQG